jgi:hypothetical protein
VIERLRREIIVFHGWYSGNGSLFLHLSSARVWGSGSLKVSMSASGIPSLEFNH